MANPRSIMPDDGSIFAVARRFLGLGPSSGAMSVQSLADNTMPEWRHIALLGSVRSIADDGLRTAPIISDRPNWRERLEQSAYGVRPVYLGREGSYPLKGPLVKHGTAAAEIGVVTTGLNLLADLPSLGHDYGVSFKYNATGRPYAVLQEALARDMFHDLSSQWIIASDQLLDPNSEFTKRAIALTGSAVLISSVPAERIIVPESVQARERAAREADDALGLFGQSRFEVGDLYVQPYQEYERQGVFNGLTASRELYDFTTRELNNLATGDLYELSRFERDDQPGIVDDVIQFMRELNIPYQLFKEAALQAGIGISSSITASVGADLNSSMTLDTVVGRAPESSQLNPDASAKAAVRSVGVIRTASIDNDLEVEF